MTLLTESIVVLWKRKLKLRTITKINLIQTVLILQKQRFRAVIWWILIQCVVVIKYFKKKETGSCQTNIPSPKEVTSRTLLMPTNSIYIMN